MKPTPLRTGKSRSFLFVQSTSQLLRARAKLAEMRSNTVAASFGG